MDFVSTEFCEFRIKRVYVASNGKKSYFYTFENEKLGSFELWCKTDLAVDKGCLYKLVLSMSSYQGDIRYTLTNVLDKN